MAYSKEYIVDTGFVDSNKRLSLSKMFLIFQEVAEEHAELIGTGRDKVTFNGRKWIITRHSVKINRLPSYGEKIKVTTYPGKNNPFFYYRYFYIEDDFNNVLLKGASIWAILDAATNKIVANAFGRSLPEESREDEVALPRKIEEDAFTKVKEHVVQYSDIDLNGHLNNTRYIELIQNVHDSEFYKDKEFKAVDVNYFLEIKEKEVVSIYLDKIDNKEIIKGAVGDKDSFKALIEYK